MAVMEEKGSVSIDAQNIMPVIKRWLYSDKDIFLREVVSNACDAITKYRMLHPDGQEEMKVLVSVDKDNKTIRISDTGIGMTDEEVKRYINQVAFSGAAEFMKQFEDGKPEEKGDIIGHFGLGFYSVFMVSEKVEIETLSCLDGAEPVHWISEDGMGYEIGTGSRTAHGTDIILHINEEEKEFLDSWRAREVLSRYCGFMAYPVLLEDANAKPVERDVPVGDEKNEDGTPKTEKIMEIPKPQQINDTNPLWLKKPADCKDEDYKEFYRKVFREYEDPLFWIHLNVDYPFNLTGILYFPKVKTNLDIQKNKINLYCNQVFVTDNVEGIVPDFMTLLHGVIDSPDIPLNVSRSYLQSDSNVKKISTYISKKVSDRLSSIFKSDRKQFEEKWDDIKIFINYGMLSETDFYDKAKAFALLKDTEGKMYTFEEYQALIKGEQTDKDGNLIYLYANNKDDQYSYIDAANAKGYNVLLMDGQLDPAMCNLFEEKFEKSRFTRVDSDVVDKLIVKSDEKKEELPEDDKKALTETFKNALPKLDKIEFNVEPQALGETAAPVIMTQSEYMRRMKDMSRLQPGMAFYGEMPTMLNLVLNTDHPLIKQNIKDAKPEVVSQLIDLALLQNGLLRGEALNNFVKRSIDLI